MLLNNKFRFVTSVSLATIAISCFSHIAHAEQVRQIRVNGAERIEESTIASYMDLKVGDEITASSTDRALKSLFSTGMFADVSLTESDGVISVNVVENPVINEIVFEGNDKIEDQELLGEIQMRERQVFSKTKVQSDVNRLYQIYRRQGRFSVLIEPKIIKLDQNRVNLVFEIQEGDVTKVKSIRFVGNKKYDDDKLRSTISTKETAWYKVLSSDDRYDPDRLSFDQELLRNFYLSQGYADFQVTSSVAELSDDKSSFFITFTVEEGERYKVSETQIISNLKNFDTTSLEEYKDLKEGDYYNADKVSSTITKMTDALGDMQYAFVSITPDIQKDRENQSLRIVYTINETPRVFVERINVNGNVRTLDKVVRREMEIVEGDPFNKSKMAESEKNIRNLDFFDDVKIDVKQGSAPDKTVVDVDVQEKSTGELSFGAGFSSTDGPLADLKLRERNLLGKGQDLSVSTTIAGSKTEFDVSFTEPYFLNRDISAGVDAYHITRDLQTESSYDQRNSGGGFRFGFPLSKNWRDTVRYRFDMNDINNVQDSASRFIKDQAGQYNTSAVSNRLAYDGRDSAIFPTSGTMYWLDTEISGLGGDSKYVSAKTGASYYYPLTDNIVTNLLGEVGAIEGYSDSDVRINERYFLGGSNLRGFSKAGIGARDATTDDALGGNYFYRASAEVAFPLGLPKEMGIKGHAFTDVGSLWGIDASGADLLDENTLRASAGVGISWRSPFGPIRLDVSTPYLKEDYDKTELVRFDFGTRF